MVRDEQIVGLWGETKVAKKRQRPSWQRCRAIMSSSFLASFTQIHLSFEYCIFTTWLKLLSSCSVCLPGCFNMYRIKAPKGDTNDWVPILTNPDIVERYLKNIVDSLHKKNLLLGLVKIYLTTRMLKTYPKRKNVLCILFAKLLSRIPSTCFFLSEVVGLIWPFTAPQCFNRNAQVE